VMTSDRWQSTQLSPAVAFLLHTDHYDPTSIKGSGRAGRILKGDVLRAIKDGTIKKATGKPATAAAASPSSSAAASAAPSAITSIRRTRDHVDLPLSQIRKVIASRLSASKQSIPHAYASITMKMNAILAMRAAWKAEGREAIPSVNDLIVRASALALRQVPAVNTVYDGRTQQFTVSPTVDISVAVATETGLITPIVKRADTKRLDTISAEVRELAGRAKQNKLKPDEFQGGSFT
jgi:pyruvate dehydrogenase E2 component (dihydrolipoamide acetyltransferase)